MRVPAILVASLVVVGCGRVESGAVDANGDGAAGIDAPSGTPAFTLTVVNPSASVPLGGMNRVVLQITRSGGFAGPVAIAGMSPPSGLTITPGMIAASATEGEVLVAGAAPLAIGGTATFTLQATGDGVSPQTVTLTDAPVTGRPGALDTTFGPAGIAAVSLGSDDAGGFRALDVVGGKVVGVGFTVGGLGTTRMLAMRFTELGVADATWNGGAVVRTSFGTGSSDTAPAYAVGRQNDGRPIAIGEHTTTNNDIAVARYSLTGGGGGVDFGDGTGKSLVNLGGAETVQDGVVLASNQIIAVGQKDGHFLIARLTSAGLLDTSFGASGAIRTILGASSSANAVAVDAQDRLIVLGTFDATGQNDLVVRRYAAAGALDGAFGANGVTIEGPDSETGRTVVADGDKVVVLSSATTGTGNKLRVRKYLATGAPDPGFGVQGVAEVSLDATAVARDMVLLPDGRIVVLVAAPGAATLFRLTPTGAIDTLFGTAGDGSQAVVLGDAGEAFSLAVYSPFRVLVGGGNQGGTPGPGTFAVIARVWM